MYPYFQGYMRFVSLLFPLIRPRKVIHIHIWTNKLNLYPSAWADQRGPLGDKENITR